MTLKITKFIDLTEAGDVDGPASATPNAVIRFSGSTGKIVKNSSVVLDDTGNLSGVAGIVFNAGGFLRSGASVNDTFVLQARDVDGDTLSTFVTLTSANSPSLAIVAPAGGTVSIDGAVIGGVTAAAGTFTNINLNGVQTWTANSTITSGSYQIGRNASSQLVFNSPGQAFSFTQNGVQCLFMDSFQYNFTQGAASGGTFVAVRVTGGAHTNLSAGSESSDVLYSLNRTVQFATGALVVQRAIQVQAPTYAFVGASTITTAATFAIAGAPSAGTNATITTPLSLWVQAGGTRVDGSLVVRGATAIPAGGTTGQGLSFSSMAGFGIYFGSGLPTLSAAQGALYLRSDGSGINTRLYVNTNGTTGWTNFASAL